MTPEQILADFKRRYENTYIFVEFPDSKEDSLFYVERIESDTDRVGIITLSSLEFGKIRLNFATDHTLKFRYPPIGVFQNGNEAYFFRRNPARQYSRGLCPENSNIDSVTSALLNSDNDRGLNFSTVSNAFKAQTFGIKEALEMLNKGRYLSVALKDNFALSLSVTESDDFLLFYFDSPVAWVKRSGEVSSLLETTYSTSVKEVLSYE